MRFLGLVSVFAVVAITAPLILHAQGPSKAANDFGQPADAKQVISLSGRVEPLATAESRRKYTRQLSSLSFANPIDYASGGYAQAVAVADLNGDGKPDMVVGNLVCLDRNESNGVCIEAEGAVSVLLGNGDGTFQPEVSYTWGGPPVVSVAIGDLNGDGIPDLAVACNTDGSAGSVVSVLIGKGDGTFQTPVSYSSGSENSIASVVIADVNGDGHPDLITANGGPDVGVLLNNGNGTFQNAVTYSVGGPGLEASSVAVGDLNGDGYPDLAVATNCGECGGSVLLGNGDGTFHAPIYFDAGQGISSVAMADLNGDGKLDLVVGVNSSPEYNNVSVLLGNGDGTFQPVVNYNPGGEGAVTSLAIADVNGDGYLDLVVGNSTADWCNCVGAGAIGGAVGILLGNGDGTFQSPISYSSGGFNSDGQIAVSDLNRDGFPDIAVPNSCNTILPDYGCDASNNSPVGVLLNIPPSAQTSATSIASSLNPWAYGAPLMLSATVTPPHGGTASGTVTFYDGWIALGSASLSDNTSTLSGIAPAFGWHLFVARYNGGEGVPASASAPLNEAANQATTATTVLASVNPSYTGQSVTFTATVAGQYGGQVTGTVTFRQGLGKRQITLCTATLVSGQATCDVTYPAVGTYTISAAYSGDANNLADTSANQGHTVKALPATTKTAVTSSGSPSLVNQTVTFSAAISSSLPIPDGETVTFYHGATVIGTGTTTNGTTALMTSFGKKGTYVIKATYPGDASHKTSSGTFKQAVDP
ncbi:MAG: FG-GAP-like repeat-containing protein [Terriglobales bacterium]